MDGFERIQYNGKPGTILRYPNGQKQHERKYIRERVELVTVWHENGQKFYQWTRKDGELDGLSNFWNDEGQKIEEGTYKDGKKVGLFTRWDDNGQKRFEETFKDGKLISKKEWNENGIEINR